MPACPRRLLAVSLTACSAVLAGCGAHGGPRLQHTDGTALIALAHRIAGEGACAQSRDIPQLRKKAIRLVNAGKVPADLQEPLMSAVTALGAQQPLCLPAVSAAPPTPKPKPPPDHGHDHGHHPGKKGHDE